MTNLFHPQYREKSDGFTLLELMVVLLFVAVLAFFAREELSRANPRLKQAAGDLYSHVQKAKVEAIRTNSDWAIKFTAGAGTYSLCSSDGGDGDWTDGDEVCPANLSITLSNYGYGVRYGSGEALVDASSTPLAAPFDTISYTGPTDIVVLKANGMVQNLGYVYLQNDGNTTYAVGTPSVAGVVVLRKWVCTTKNGAGVCTAGAWR